MVVACCSNASLKLVGLGPLSRDDAPKITEASFWVCHAPLLRLFGVGGMPLRELVS